MKKANSFFKYTFLVLISASMLIGGMMQIIAWNSTVVQYNAYFQFAIGFFMFIWLSHKLLSYYDNRNSKPITNARDKKK